MRTPKYETEILALRKAVYNTIDAGKETPAVLREWARKLQELACDLAETEPLSASGGRPVK